MEHSKIKSFLTVKEYAKAVGTTPDAIRHRIFRKRLKAIKVGRDWLIPKKELPK